MGRLLQETGKPAEAIDMLTRAEPAARRVFVGARARRLAELLSALGRARSAGSFDADRFTLAESNLLEAHAIFVNALGPAHRSVLNCARSLAELYTSWEAAQPGKGYSKKAAECQATLDSKEPKVDPK